MLDPAPIQDMEVDPPAVPVPETTEQPVAEQAQEEKPEQPASETLYIQNLNERVKLKVLKQTLRNLYRNFGPVLDVVAHSNVRMRGQAFVALDTKEAAAKALKDTQKFPLYGKPLQVSYAKTRSDALVKRKTPGELDSHKAERLQRKSWSRFDKLTGRTAHALLMIEVSRSNNPLRKKQLAKRAEEKESIKKAIAEGKMPTDATTSGARKIIQMPDEYLPPNKILFVQNLPDTITKAALETMFKQYPSFLEVRTIPGRKNIAFVEYLDETSSSTARDALHNSKISEQKIKITFAKK